MERDTQGEPTSLLPVPLPLAWIVTPWRYQRKQRSKYWDQLSQLWYCYWLAYSSSGLLCPSVFFSLGTFVPVVWGGRALYLLDLSPKQCYYQHRSKTLFTIRKKPVLGHLIKDAAFLYFHLWWIMWVWTTYLIKGTKTLPSKGEQLVVVGDYLLTNTVNWQLLWVYTNQGVTWR